MSTVFHSVNVTKREGVHRFNEVTLRRWENKKNHRDFSSLPAGLQLYSNIQKSWSTDCKGDIQKTVPSVDGNICPHQSLSHILHCWKNET